MDLAMLLTAISTIAALIAILQSARANRLERRIASLQGALTVPDIKIGFMGDETTTEFYFAVPLTEKRVVEVPTLLTFRNAGEKSARDIEIYFRLPRRLIFGGTGAAVIELSDPTERVTLRSVAQSEHTETFLLRVPVLHPDQRYAFVLKLSFSYETCREQPVSAQTKDGYTVNAVIRVEFAEILDVTASQADQRAFTRSFSIRTIDTATKSVGDYFATRNSYAKTSRKRRKAKSSFKVFEASRNVLQPDATLPIDRIPMGAEGELHEGLRIGDKFFVPSARVTRTSVESPPN